jgi:hypothetical protein
MTFFTTTFRRRWLEENPEQFKDVVRGLILGLGVWLPPAAYERFPLLVPYAVRDAACRGDRRRGIPDQWGAPDSSGRFRDDNSLIKGIPRSLMVTNPSRRLSVRTSLRRSMLGETGGGERSSKPLKEVVPWPSRH